MNVIVLIDSSIEASARFCCSVSNQFARKKSLLLKRFMLNPSSFVSPIGASKNPPLTLLTPDSPW